MMDADLESHTIVNTFTEFLIVAIHQILRKRKMYPPTTFILAKKYNLPVHQIRHPGLCAFLNRETLAIRQAILSKTVRRIFVAIFAQGLPREHFIFDVARMSRSGIGTRGEEAGFEAPLPLVDAEEQMRAVLSKLKDHCASLEPLNDQNTFRMIMEVDEDPTFDSDNEQQDKATPNTPTADECCIGEHVTNMVKIRSVEAGGLAFDLWYEVAQMPPQLSTNTHIQPLASGGAPSSPSDLYGTFPSM